MSRKWCHENGCWCVTQVTKQMSRNWCHENGCYSLEWICFAGVALLLWRACTLTANLKVNWNLISRYADAPPSRDGNCAMIGFSFEAVSFANVVSTMLQWQRTCKQMNVITTIHRQFGLQECTCFVGYMALQCAILVASVQWAASQWWIFGLLA